MLLMAKAGKRNGYLLEGMACLNGCVGGPGTLQPKESSLNSVNCFAKNSKIKLKKKRKIKKVTISKRLKEIAKLVKGPVVADIGCDHGKLSVYLALNKGFLVYACDIRQKPLQKAIENSKKSGVCENILFLKTDGLKNLPEKINCVVVAGMGGKLIERIILKSSLVRKKNITLILQPQSFLYELRQKLALNGFSIEKEVAVLDKGKHYIILVVRFLNKVKTLSLKEAIVGKLLVKNKESSFKFLKAMQKKELQILKGLLKSKKTNEIKIKISENICKILNIALKELKEG